MVVKEKQSDIAILRTWAPRRAASSRIFIVQGAIIGLVGTLAGVALGVLTSTYLESLVHGLERLLHTRFLDASVYFMSDLPALVEMDDVLRIAGHGVRAVLPLDALSGLACGAHPASRGAAP